MTDPHTCAHCSTTVAACTRHRLETGERCCDRCDHQPSPAEPEPDHDQMTTSELAARMFGRDSSETAKRMFRH